MRDYDILLLTHMVQRPGVYTGQSNYTGVDRFLIAYEMGSQGACDFIGPLSNALFEKYQIPIPSEGIIKQCTLVADQLGITWEELFVKESEDILISESDKDGRSRYAHLIRYEILKLLEEIPEFADINLWLNLKRISKLINVWKGVNIKKEEQTLLIEILESIGRKRENNFMNPYKLSNEEQNKMKELNRLLKQNNEL